MPQPVQSSPLKGVSPVCVEAASRVPKSRWPMSLAWMDHREQLPLGDQGIADASVFSCLVPKGHRLLFSHGMDRGDGQQGLFRGAGG